MEAGDILDNFLILKILYKFESTVSDAPVVFIAKQRTALARIKRHEDNLDRIKLANNQLYQEQAADINITSVPPERKSDFVLTEDYWPYLKVGEFVKVKAKTDTGYNRIEGYAYIAETFGAGIAAYYTVKYTPVYDGGPAHKMVKLGDLTPCSPYDDCLP